MLGILLIYICKVATGVISLPIIGGILACGIILILTSILGLVGAVKHHQVILFFYMIILFILFVIQFSIACSCLAVNSERVRIAHVSFKRSIIDLHSCSKNILLKMLGPLYRTLQRPNCKTSLTVAD